jgi:hypothetical protein
VLIDGGGGGGGGEENLGGLLIDMAEDRGDVRPSNDISRPPSVGSQWCRSVDLLTFLLVT